MLEKYNQKRNFAQTAEPKGEKAKMGNKLHYVVQHHLARREHYDLRLEWNGVLLSWAVPKGPSFNPDDKRLAIHVEDHPLEYRNFEGEIPKGQYGGGTVTIWDKGFWRPLTDVDKTITGDGPLKFILEGTKLQGAWMLIKTKSAENHWLLRKEKDGHSQAQINISSPDKVLFADSGVTKLEIAQYYQKIAERMLPYIRDRRLALVVCPQGITAPCFYKKNNADKVVLDPINDVNGILSHVQNNTLEFHVWGSTVSNIDKPDIMVFDLDPDEGMGLGQIHQGVKDLKSILDKLELVSFLKTSGNKGYHIVVPFRAAASWDAFGAFAKQIAVVMEKTWPKLYTSNVRKVNRKGKIFIDWIRNGKGATSIAPYSVRAKPGARVSMPIAWNELDKIAPNSITMDEAINRIKTKADPWAHFFEVQAIQSIK